MIGAFTPIEIWSIGLVFLLVYSIVDFKEKKIENREIVFFLFVGVMFSLMSKEPFLPHFIAVMALFVISYFLWRLDCMGGADAKIIPILGFYLPMYSIANMVVQVVSFVLYLGIGTLLFLSSVYISRKILKTKIPKDGLPYLFIITLAYIFYGINSFFF